MKIRLRWTNVPLRTITLVVGIVLLALTQSDVVRFVYQGY